ncbi:MAG: type II toxin-antitoxin system HigB family toxin [Verrucomicrobia bacterium]|nr:type II toxin-antitoxin system HigB family toxin [Verrucomicrobiota bacterium]
MRAAADRYPKAAKFLATWVVTVRAARWRNLAELRQAYASPGQVLVARRRPVIVFNVCGNSYRLIVAIHFDHQTAYTLQFLPHAEYNKDRWKDEL